MKQLHPDGYGFTVAFNTGQPIIGLQIVTPEQSYMVPMDVETADNLATILADHVTALRMAERRCRV